MDMDFNRESPGLGQMKTFEGGSLRPKSSLRMIYAAEIKIFTSQYGGLENIRQKLGFSRRKMCQLLLVDPSAWTRWCRDETKVPPHIYRSLEWFLALNQKAFTQPDLAAIFSARYKSTAFRGEIEQLREELSRQKQVTLYLTMGLVALGISLSYLLIQML